MPSTYVSDKFAKLAADGATTGLLEIGDNTNWLPGAAVTIVSDTQGGIPLVVIEQVGTTKIRCRRKDSLALRGGGADLSLFTMADNASINMEGQVIPVLATFTPRDRA